MKIGQNYFRLIMLVLSVLFFVTISAQEQLSNLPTFYINTDNNIKVTSKDTYIKASLTIKSTDETEQLTNFVTEIRGRGNSTWNMVKKPYRIKLDKKTKLLNLPAKEKSWVLLANYADKTLMRNAVALKISEMIGLDFTPSVRFIDVVLNGEFLGNYMVSDQVQVAGEYRVPVEEQEITATELPYISGGYLLEIDGFAASEPKWFTTPKALKITIKYPNDDEINSAQENYIKNYINTFENVLFSSNFKDPDKGYRAWVDIKTLVNWYIACELTGNSDSFWSTYIYKKYDDPKIYFGPMWDYDIAFNNDNRLGDATRKLMRNYAHNPRTWIERMWQDEWFQQAVNERWIELKNDGLENKLINYIDETSVLLQSSQQLNFEKWNILDRRVYREQYLFNTYDKGVEYLKSYVKDRISFLTQSFASSVPEKPSEAFIAEDYYYMIMNKKTNNVITVNDSSLSGDALLSLYSPDANDDTDDSQLWAIKALDGGLFRFVNKNSNMAMAANGRGNALKQVEKNDNDATQKWNILPVLTGNIYGIVNPVSGYSINNEGGRFTEGNPVVEWDNNIYSEDKLNQHWYLQKMEKVETGIGAVQSANAGFRIVNGYVCLTNIPNNSVIEVINMQGCSVITEKNVVGETAFKLPYQGIYMLRIISKNGNYSKKFYYSI